MDTQILTTTNNMDTTGDTPMKEAGGVSIAAQDETENRIENEPNLTSDTDSQSQSQSQTQSGIQSESQDVAGKSVEAADGPADSTPDAAVGSNSDNPSPGIVASPSQNMTESLAVDTKLPPPCSDAQASTSPHLQPAASGSDVAMDTSSPMATADMGDAAACEAAAASCSMSPDKNTKLPHQSVYHVKWVKFRKDLVPIITQNENGPCPLLALMNVLTLQAKVKLPPMMEMVTSEQLMDYLGNCIFEHAPKNITEDAMLNYEQNMHDALAMFHKLQTGLDVNVKFTGVSHFEYTPECIVFDLLGIPLYHGWLVDPQNTREVAAVTSCSYNQLVEKIISDKNSPKEELVTEALIAEDFLNSTCHQLTYHGLSELASTVKELELCVFFRNNHFSSLYKNKGELFLLVTDQGFLTEGNVVWETLCNVEGDGNFVDTDFHTYRKPEPSTHPIPASSVPVGSDQQVDTDYLVALSLQQEQQGAPAMPATAPAVAVEVPGPKDWATPPASTLSDHELALKLQEEEDRRAAAVQHRQQQQQERQQHLSQQYQQQQAEQRESSREAREKKSDCVIL